MPRNKNETLSIRTTAEIKSLLRLVAERERRSVASMIEVLVLSYANQNALKLGSKPSKAKKAQVG